MKYHLRLYIILVFVLYTSIFLSLSMYAQSSGERFKNIYFEKLSFDNGLSNNIVKCIFQDSEGYIWFGTADGLDRYDGKSFKIFKNDPVNAHSLCGNIITGIAEDREGLIWITTQDGGLSCYKRSTVSSIQFEQYKHDPNNPLSIPANNLTGLTIDNNENIWVASENNGVFKIDRKTKKITCIGYKEKNSRTSNFNYGCDVLKTDYNGNIWCGCYNDSVFCVNPANNTTKNYHYIQAANGIKLTKGSIHSLLLDKGTLWFPRQFGNLNKFDFITNAFNQYTLESGNLSEKQNDYWLEVEKDANGIIWIGSQKNGLYAFNPSINKFYNFRYNVFNPGSLSDNTVNCLYFDNTGILWVGTNKGICKYDPLTNQIMYHYVKDEKRPNLTDLNIYDFYEDNDGSFWLATDEGLFIRDKNAPDFKCKYSSFHNKPLIIYKFFKYVNGKVYLITNTNNLVYEKAKNRLIGIPFCDNKKAYNDSYTNSIKTAVVTDTIYNIKHMQIAKGFLNIPAFLVKNKDNLEKNNFRSYPSFWVGSIGSGLFMCRFLKKDCIVTISSSSSGNAVSMDNKRVQAIIKDNEGKIWIATNGGGLNAVQDKSLLPKFISYKNEPGNPYSLSSNSISDMCLDKDGIFWITTYDGVLNRFNPNAKNKKYFTSIAGFDDLSKQGMYSIVCDRKNNLWIVTAAALLKYDISANKFSAWKLKDQLPYDQYPGKKYIGKDGTIYFGGNKFYISFNPDLLHINSSIPQVAITSFKVFNIPADDELINNEIKLKHNENFFSFEFASLNFSNSRANKFAHKLDGIDKNWVYTANRNSATYTDIQPGSYIFHVKASNNNDVWNEKGIAIKITIVPAWWQTLLFKIAFTLTVIAFIFFPTRYYFRQKFKAQQMRVEKIKAIENIRSKIAMDIHDQIGAQLTKITLLNQRIKLGFETKSKINLSLFDKVTISSKEVVNNLGEIIWAVNPKHDNLQSLLSYIRNYTNNFFENTTATCVINFPEHTPAVTVSPDTKHNLFLVLKEALNNILKHAEATKVVVSFYVINEQMCFEIIDNGKGIDDMHGRQFCNGLISMKNRMEAVNGKFEIKSEKNKGTKIILSAELKNRV